jgi:hypothetical protein
MKNISLALGVAFAFASLAPAAPRPAPVYDCEGTACSQVALAWEEEGQQFRAQNNSERRVRFEVSTFAGSSSVSVEPGKSEYLKVKSFNGPYHADYE